MKNSIKITDFDFQFVGYGHYKVTYTSPVTNKAWKNTITDMTLIDATKNEDQPKKKDLISLKKSLKKV